MIRIYSAHVDNKNKTHKEEPPVSEGSRGSLLDCLDFLWSLITVLMTDWTLLPEFSRAEERLQSLSLKEILRVWLEHLHLKFSLSWISVFSSETERTQWVFVCFGTPIVFDTSWVFSRQDPCKSILHRFFCFVLFFIWKPFVPYIKA